MSPAKKAPMTQPIQVAPLPVEAMTSRQLVRRAELIEAVIDLVREVGPGAVQMRDVADRSGIALGTVYRYFSSKEHLLATALADWQERLTRRVLMPRAGEDGLVSGDLTEPSCPMSARRSAGSRATRRSPS
jgi:AcrR family transcriptional regulator